MLRTSCLAILMTTFFSTAAWADTPPTWYVSPAGNDAWSGHLAEPNAGRSDGPFATLVRARDEVRQQQAAGKLNDGAVVQVRGGRYELSAPLVFEPQDSGKPGAPIVYTAYANEKPVISGGRLIGGWKKGNGPLWQTEIPDVREGRWYFRQLFVDAQRRTRARTPNEGYLRAVGPTEEYSRDRKANAGNQAIRTAIKFRKGDLDPKWQNLDDVNLFLYHSWTNSLHWLKRIDAEAGVVQFANPTGWPVCYWEREQRYYVDNVREALDSPGEWYLNRRSGLLEYWPLPGENLEKCQVVAPRMSQLLKFEGRWAEGQFVHNLAFCGLAFQHADWTVEDQTKAVDGQSAVFLPGAVQAQGAERITLEDCEIAHVGGYGVWFETGCKHNRVVRCEIHDLGGGGVRLGENMRQQSQSKTDAEKRAAVPQLTFEGNGPRDTGHNIVANCFIHNGGQVFAAGTGVFLGHTGFNQIVHNEICDLYYSGVCVGWVWGFGKSVAHHNRIADNHIHHLGWGVLSDMGGVYTLGPSPGTVVHHNLVHHVNSYSYGGWGLYTDEGSSEIVLEYNVVYDTKSGGFHQHYGADNVIRNNIFAFSRESQIRRSREDLKNSVIFDRNVVYCDNDQVLTQIWKNGDYRVDDNVYWSIGKTAPLFDGREFEEWKATSGQDRHSLLADPLFVNAAARDLRLRPDSPAFKLGFKPIELQGFGLTGDAAWTAKPKQVRRPEFILPDTAPPAPTSVDDDFENTPVGSPPRDAVVHGEEKDASIRVTDELAAGGKHCLKVTDMPGLSQTYQPHFFYKLNTRKGLAHGSFDVRLGKGAMMQCEWRDTARPYRVGPSLRIDAAGDLLTGKKKLMSLPHDTWIHVEIVCGLGPQSTGTYDLSVTVAGQPSQRFEKLPLGSPESKELRWLGFISPANAEAVYYLDNLKLSANSITKQ